MRKIHLLVTIVFFLCAVAAAQQPSAGDTAAAPAVGNDYGCSYKGDGGHIDALETGKVIDIIDGNSVIFLTSNGKKRRVDLIAVDTSANNKAARAFLINNLLNLETSLSFSSSQDRKNNVKGLFDFEGTTINAALLERGLGRYKSSKSYQISGFNKCVAIGSEKKAKEAKVGIWAK